MSIKTMLKAIAQKVKAHVIAKNAPVIPVPMKTPVKVQHDLEPVNRRGKTRQGKRRGIFDVHGHKLSVFDVELMRLCGCRQPYRWLTVK